MFSLMKSRLSGKTLFFIFVFIILSTYLNSIIINVPDDQPTIQDGIDAAVNGDVVLVQPDTYVENINFNGKLITVGSLFITTADTTYISSTIIDGSASGRVVAFTNTENSTAVLSGFTITNGSHDYGGGIICSSSSPSLENLIISGNSSMYGGGIYCYWYANPNLYNITISGNSADQYGGGINCDSYSNPSLEDIIITGNSAIYGGGMNCYNYSSPSLEDVTILGNTATGNGGGIYCNMYSDLHIYSSTITGNYAYFDGGGIYCGDNSNPYMQYITISGNTGAQRGGGINCNSSSPNLWYVTISDNTALGGGGISCVSDSDPYLQEVTISGNTAVQDGGGIYCYDYSTPHISNNTISNNVAANGGGIYCDETSTQSIYNTTISDNYASDSGGGINCKNNSHVYYTKGSIIRNHALGFGGGIYSSNCVPVLESVIISGNYTEYYDGGGIYCYGYFGPKLYYTTIFNNRAERNGGGIYCEDSNPELENVTMTENIAYNDGGGIYCWNNSSATIKNSILWNDSPEEFYLLGGSITATYSDIEGGLTGIGNFDSDPFFVDPIIDDYNLQLISPCIDAGDPASPLDPDGTRAEMGAYHFDQSYNGIPSITDVTDVPNDQGRSVIVTWEQSFWDYANSDVPIVNYGLWEKYPFELDRDYLITNDINEAIQKQDTYFQREDTTWVFIVNVPAMQWTEYSALAETFFDSTSVGDYLSYFFISAHTENPSLHFRSSTASGYSVDNIAPDETEVYIAQNGSNMNINWNEVEYGTYQGNSYPEINGIWYKIYAGNSPDFVCDEYHLIETVTNLNYEFSLTGEDKKFFKIVVSDQP